MKNKRDDILLIIEHPFGTIEMSLEEWLKTGAGSRKLLKPYKVKDKLTGKQLPLGTIPLKYRNNSLSRFLIKLGIIENPWQ